MTDRDPSVTLHSSWRGIVSGLIGSTVLVTLGIAGLAAGRGTTPTVITIAGILLVAAVTLDLPVACRLDTDGVQRRMMLRRQHIPWSRITALSRGRPSLSARRRDLDPGPLVALIGRRRYLLVDQSESLHEYEDLLDVLRASGRGDDIEALLPPADSRTPTWTYRRRRWHPGADTRG